MQKLLQGMVHRVKAFVEGSDHVGLMVVSESADALPLLKIFEEVEATSASDLFWSFTDHFVDARSYADGVVSAFSVQHESMNEAFEREGMVPWPPMPAAALSILTPPAERLRTLAAYSRELLPVPFGGNNVWVFYPLEVSDPFAFAGFMATVMDHEFPFPWCHHLRFVVRDAVPSGAPSPLQDTPRLDWWRPDLSQEAVNQALASQVEDESVPLDDRMGAVLMLAGSDFAVHRYEASLEKYELLLRYHATNGNLPMAALAMNGMGECFHRMARLDEANSAYQSALIPASDGDPPAIPVLLNIVVNLANLRMEQEIWDQAEGYWDSAQQLAAASRNAPARIEALEQRGVCQEYLGRLDDAETSWDAGSIMAAKIEDPWLCEKLLERLEGLYQKTFRRAEAAGVSKMLADLRG